MPSKYPDLVNRLRGVYVIPVNDGAGLLDGKDTFTRQFPTVPIQLEAADRIEELEGLLRQVEQVAALVRIKADACDGLGANYNDTDWNGRNWAGLAAELRDTVWTLEELAAGRKVAALMPIKKK